MHFGISTKGIRFRERWNIVEKATEKEFKEYIRLETKISNMRVRDSQTGRWNQSIYGKRQNERVKQQYIRKCWRTRYGNEFKKDQLYRIDKKIHRYNCKVSPRGGNGVMGLWTLSRLGNNLGGLEKENLVVYSHTDELGMYYFSRVDQIDSAHLYVFKPDDHQLCAIVPLEET